MNEQHVQIHDWTLAQENAAKIKSGSRFLFTQDKRCLENTLIDASAQRLQLHANARALSGAVKALVPGTTLDIPGMSITTEASPSHHFSALIPDRDLYKAEQDTVNLLVVLPNAAQHQTISLQVNLNGAPFYSLDITSSLAKNNGMALESLSALLPGQYSAQLLIDDMCIAEPAHFVVAHYQLAPFDANLIAHTLDPDSDTLHFELAVTSYELPWQSRINVMLIENGLEQQRTTLDPQSDGHFSGRFSLLGEGPFILRLIASDDASRLCEVALPGSAQAQRQSTLISELGPEIYLSMLPMPESIPVRGGFIQQGEKRDIPIEINQCITDKPVLLIHQKTQALSVLSWDMLENTWHESRFEDLDAGDEIALTGRGKMMMVFIGAWINQQPFEGYATVLSTDVLQLKIDSAQSLRPGQMLELKITLNSDRPLPVYLNIRDSRLSASKSAQTDLGQCLKQQIESMSEAYTHYRLAPLNERGEFTQALSPFGGFAPDAWDEEVDYMESAMAPEPFASGAQAEEHDPLSMLCEARNPQPRSAPVKKELMSRSRLSDNKEQSKSAPPEPPQARGQFPDSVFCALVYVHKQEILKLKMGDNLGRISIDAFVYDDGNWCAAKHSFIVDQPVRADIDFPPVVQPGDAVYGRIRAHSASGKARVELYLDEKPVTLTPSNGLTKTPLEREIPVQPGTYRLCVTDPDTGETDSVRFEVNAPGKAKTLSNALQLLQPGQTLTLDTHPGTLSIDLLPGFDQVSDKLLNTTAGYAHLCCEQTAAKILAACAMYISSEDMKTRQEAEKIILAGVARESKMISKKKGFKMYPEGDYVSEYYSKLAVQYLWQLHSLQHFKGLSDSLKRAIEQGLNYADRAAKVHKLKRFTEQPTSMAEAWSLACEQPKHKAINTLIEKTIDLSAGKARLKTQADPVYARTTMAYAAACLLKQEDIKNAITLANQVMQDINEDGALYSTVDSVALIAMMSVLKSHPLFAHKPKLRINGQLCDPTSLNNTLIETIEVVEGTALVQISHIVEHDWIDTTAAMKVSTALVPASYMLKHDWIDAKVNTNRNFNMGDRIELQISLEEGYVNGDLAHINLPAALSWIQGGGRVKQFSVDFAGKQTINVPLLVTSKVQGPQHFAVLVRNMFEQERVACPGLLEVS